MSWLWMWGSALAILVDRQPLRIVVNIPAYRLEAYVEDSLAQTIAIAPGTVRYQTPRGAFMITSLEWNPWWVPPKSPWAAKEKPMRPGPGNPMGRVKMKFQPLLFVHGSPLEHTIGTAASHGCVRLKNEDAIALARLVHRFGSPSLGLVDVDRLARDSATRELELDAPIPLDIRYDLVEVRDRRVSVYRDVYRLATRSPRNDTYAALAANGIDTLTIDAARVRALVRNIPAKGRSLLLDSLVRR